LQRRVVPLRVVLVAERPLVRFLQRAAQRGARDVAPPDELGVFGEDELQRDFVGRRLAELLAAPRHKGLQLVGGVERRARRRVQRGAVRGGGCILGVELEDLSERV